MSFRKSLSNAAVLVSLVVIMVIAFYSVIAYLVMSVFHVEAGLVITGLLLLSVFVIATIDNFFWKDKEDT